MKNYIGKNVKFGIYDYIAIAILPVLLMMVLFQPQIHHAFSSGWASTIIMCLQLASLFYLMGYIFTISNDRYLAFIDRMALPVLFPWRIIRKTWNRIKRRVPWNKMTEVGDWNKK